LGLLSISTVHNREKINVINVSRFVFSRIVKEKNFAEKILLKGKGMAETG
jgi:hypothetical protein